MKKLWAALMAAGVLAMPGFVQAEEAPAPADGQPAAEAPQIDPSLTNKKADYPAPAEALPPVPVPPEGGLSDTKGFLAYQQAVDAYIKAAQAYIDGATNDANDIVAKRNEAVKAANDTVAKYNSFLDANAKK